MRNWFRAVIVVAVFAVAAFTAPAEGPAVPELEPGELEPTAPVTAETAPAEAETIELSDWQEEYGDCHISCGDEPYVVNFVTYEQCCNELHLCPDGSYPQSKYWSPYVGWPLLCMT